LSTTRLVTLPGETASVAGGSTLTQVATEGTSGPSFEPTTKSM